MTLSLGIYCSGSISADELVSVNELSSKSQLALGSSSGILTCGLWCLSVLCLVKVTCCLACVTAPTWCGDRLQPAVILSLLISHPQHFLKLHFSPHPNSKLVWVSHLWIHSFHCSSFFSAFNSPFPFKVLLSLLIIPLLVDYPTIYKNVQALME